jgi:hypothetical protein
MNTKIIIINLVIVILILSSIAGYFIYKDNHTQDYTVTLVGKYDTYTDNVKAYSYYSPPPELPQYPDNRYATISVKFRGWYKDPAYEHMWISGEDQVVCNMHLYAQMYR